MPVLILSVLLAAPAVDVGLRESNELAHEAFVKGDYAAALRHYEALEADLFVLDRPGDLAVLRTNIAHCLESLGRLQEARDRYEQALKGPLPSAVRAQVEERLTTLRPGFLELRCGPSVLRVTVRERSESCGALVQLEAGVYEVTVFGAGGNQLTRRVRVKAGERRELHLQSQVRAVAPAPVAAEGSPEVALGLALGAVAVGGVGLAMNLFARSNVDQADELERELRADPTQHDRLAPRIGDLDDSATTLVWASYGAYALATGLLVGAGVEWSRTGAAE